MRRAAKVEGEKYLGALCKRSHDYEGTGKSLRKASDRSCVVCARERALAAYHQDPAAYTARSDPEKRRKHQAEWKRADRQANPEKWREIAKARYQRENLKIRLRVRLRKALIASVGGKRVRSHEYVDFMAIIEYLGPCPGDLSEWEIDHIKPLSSFDFSDPEQIRVAFHPTNHQWLTAEENRKKHAKTS